MGTLQKKLWYFLEFTGDEYEERVDEGKNWRLSTRHDFQQRFTVFFLFWCGSYLRMVHTNFYLNLTTKKKQRTGFKRNTSHTDVSSGNQSNFRDSLLKFFDCAWLESQTSISPCSLYMLWKQRQFFNVDD